MKTLSKIVSIAQDLSSSDKSFENKQGNMIYMKNETLKMLKKSVLSFRSSRPEVFCKKGLLWSFAKFTGKHLCPFLRTLFFTERLWWLLINFRHNAVPCQQSNSWSILQTWINTSDPCQHLLVLSQQYSSRKSCKMCSKLTIKTPERRHWRS